MSLIHQLGVLNRRFGVPLLDGGAVRLPQLIGLSRALDLIMTGRIVAAEEALQMGLVNRLCKPGTGNIAFAGFISLVFFTPELKETAMDCAL